jgi:hypothetical protein
MRGLLWPLVPAAILALLIAGCGQPQHVPAAKPAAPVSGNVAQDTGGQAGNDAPNTGNAACDILAGKYGSNIQGVEPAKSNGTGNAVCAVHVSFSNLGAHHDQKATLISIVALYTGNGTKAAYYKSLANSKTVIYPGKDTSVFDLSGVGVHGFSFGPDGSQFTVIDIDLSAPDGLLSDASTLTEMITSAYLALAHQA